MFPFPTWPDRKRWAIVYANWSGRYGPSAEHKEYPSASAALQSAYGLLAQMDLNNQKGHIEVYEVQIRNGWTRYRRVWESSTEATVRQWALSYDSVRSGQESIDENVDDYMLHRANEARELGFSPS